ncbi:hypothetical protein MNBD_GAMMA05-1760 [hydrothermal vent metagenome]|uniref:Uncharacterized protein n=1 Tax=hydrothermal vent metagenome TaxID=652676 RepID=A0A3B0WLP4_9ZZZZ
MFLNMQKMVSNLNTVRSYSTAKSFIASEELIKRIGSDWPDKKTSINNFLFAELFYFKRNLDDMLASGIYSK